MREKTTDEFHGRQSHLFLFPLIAIVEILEGDGMVGESQDTMIGDGNAKDVTTKILHQLLDATQRRLDVDFPIFGKSLGDHLLGIESTVVGIQFACCPELCDGETKAVAELMGEQFDREEELARGRLPAIARGSRDQSATGDHAMQMRMSLHGLPPGMQDQGETDLATQILLPELLQDLSRHFEEQVVEQLLVEGDQGIENVIDSEDDMIVRNGQDPELLGFEPLSFFKSTTLGAMTVLAGFIRKFPMFAFGAHLQDATQSRRATIHDRTDGFGLLIREWMSAFVFAHVLAENLSDTEFRPLVVMHDTPFESIALIIQGSSNGLRYPWVGGRRQHRFAGTNFQPRKLLENAQTPTRRVHAVLAGFLNARLTTEKRHSHKQISI